EKKEAELKDKVDKVQHQLAEEKAVVAMLKGQIRDLKDKEEHSLTMLGQRLSDAEAVIANETTANQRLTIAMQSAQAQSEQVIATLQVEITRLQEQNRQIEIAAQMARQYGGAQVVFNLFSFRIGGGRRLRITPHICKL
ncbi:hypothetical protein BVRB_021770, partial [Beta vulgaris subsp. vulgaris]